MNYYTLFLITFQWTITNPEILFLEVLLILLFISQMIIKSQLCARHFKNTIWFASHNSHDYFYLQLRKLSLREVNYFANL